LKAKWGMDRHFISQYPNISSRLLKKVENYSRMKKLLRILVVEDSEDDALLVLHQIKNGGYDIDYERVQTAETMKAALNEKTWDIILSDYKMPHFNGIEALSIFKESGIDIPFIIISGTIGEETAVEAMKAGAHDYVMKNNMLRLLPAIEWELRESKNRAERKLLEQKLIQAEALKISEEKYRNIFDHIPDGLLLLEVTDDGRFRNLEMNSSLANLTGIDRSYMIGKFQEEVVPEETAKIVNAKYRRCVETGLPIEEESELELSVGKRIFQSSFIPIRNETGRIHRIVGITHDITEHKQAVDALRESEEKHRILFRDSPDAYLILKDGIFVDCNPATEVMLRGDRSQIVGQLPEAISPEFQPDGCKSSEAAAEKIKTALTTGINTFEWVHRRFDGTDFFVEVTIALMKLNGKPALFTAWRDITKHKLAEEALRESEERYRQLVEMSPDAIAIHQHGKIVYINTAGAIQFGVQKPQEMIGKSILDVVHPDYRAAVIQRVEKTMSGESAPYAVEKFIKLDGTIFDVEVTAIPSVYQGKPATQVVIRDITERKQAEEALQYEQTLLRLLIDNIPDFIYTKDTACRKTLSNMADVQHMGAKSEAEVLGKDDFAFHPKEIAEKFFTDDQLVIQTGQPLLNCEEYSFDEEGQIKWLLTSKFPLRDEKGQIIGLVGITRDITKPKQAEEALRESEERFRHLFEVSPEAIMLIDPFDTKEDWPIVDCNEIACKMNGYTREELIGKSIDIVNISVGKPEERAVYLEKLRQAPLIHLETFHRHRDGHIFPTEVSTSLVTFLGREMVLGIDRNISERKQAEEEIKLKNEQLLKLNAEKDKFFSIISHDLKSPFNSFLGLTQIMAEELPSLTMSQVQEIAMSMSKSATNLYRLLENLLQWAKMQRGLIPFDPEVILLHPVVDECIATMLEPAKKKGIDLTSDIQENLKVFADNNMLQTVIRNLISNALKFTRKGGKISISAKATGDKSVEISVKDSGIGMKPEMIDNLFRLNVKTNREGTEGEPSSGLGLLLCKEFVEKHGGKIWVESEVGKGSTFHFTLQIGT